jgi:hypothetical protein
VGDRTLIENKNKFFDLVPTYRVNQTRKEKEEGEGEDYRRGRASGQSLAGRARAAGRLLSRTGRRRSAPSLQSSIMTVD